MKNPIIYPRLATNQIVEIKGEKYRAEIWRQGDKLTYEFVYLGENGLSNFEKSEQEVSEAIKKGIIKI
jgi:hypothetical protein